MIYNNMGKMMKVLVVSNMYPSKKYPHYGTFVKHTVSLMRENEIKVDVESISKIDNKWLKCFNYFSFYLKSIFRMVFFNYDYIYVHYVSHSSIPALIVSKIKKLSIVANVHGNDIVPETKNDYKYLNYSKKLLNVSSKIICPSEYFKQILIKNYKVNDDDIIIYPSGGVDTKLFKKIDRIEALDKMGLPNNRQYIGFVSRLEKNKGYDIFLKACYKLHNKNGNVRFIVVGDGDESREYETLVRRYRLENCIIKYDLLSQEKLIYLFNAMNVFVFPTYRKSESLGLVGLEAMACETVTVLPNLYGPASYARDEFNSYVFQSGNSEDLYEKIEKALRNDNDLLCKHARATAQEYDSHVTDEVLIRVFKD